MQILDIMNLNCTNGVREQSDLTHNEAQGTITEHWRVVLTAYYVQYYTLRSYT